MATIDESRKSEDVQRAKAEKARKTIDQLPRQVVEARMGDKHIQLCVEATEAALKDAKKKTEAAIKAEKKALEATKEVKDAEAKLKTEADKLEAIALEAEAKATAEKPETVVSPPNQEEEAGAAETIASTKQDATNKRDSADKAKATAEKPEADPTVAGLRQQEQESLAASSQARVEEKLALEVLANAQRQEEFFRSRFLPPKWWQPSQETLALLFSKESLTALIFLVIGLVGLFMITSFIFKPEFLDKLGNINSARALVTFLVALSAVIIAIIITLYAVVSSDTDKEFFEKKFNHAKEVFTAFVGILGTIMGFYFATNDTGKTVLPLPVLSSDRSEAHPGDTVKFTSLMYKGKPPFDWKISSLPEGIKGSGTDSDNYIEAQVPIPPAVDPRDYDITLTVEDSEENNVAEPKRKLTVIGSPTDKSSDGIPPKFELSVDPNEVQAGKPITLKSKGSFDVGAVYEISFDPGITLNDGKDKGKLEIAGQFDGTVDIPLGTPATKYTVILKVTDNTGKTVEEKGKLKINSQ